MEPSVKKRTHTFTGVQHCLGALLAIASIAAGAFAQGPAWTAAGTEDGELFGWSTRAAGDVNGDGYTDIISGAWSNDRRGNDAGAMYVLSGRDGTMLNQVFYLPDSEFGRDVAGAGDVNGDGRANFIVGAPGFDRQNGTDAGIAVVYGYNSSLTFPTAVYLLYGDNPGDQFGWAVHGGGDVNADGYDDFVVGAPFHDRNGADRGLVRVFSGRDGSVLYNFYGAAPDDRLGIRVAIPGDVNGDGHADVFAGAHMDDTRGTDAGMARVFSGADGAVLHTFYGDAAGDQFGSYVNAAGDVDADDHADLIVGAQRADGTSGADCGLARVFSGQSGAVLYDFYGDAASARLGRCVAGAGDVDADGHDDLIVGAHLDDTRGSNAGMARVYSGADGSVLQTFHGKRANDRFGRTVSGAGDIDFDGYADVLVGATSALDPISRMNTGMVYAYSMAPLVAHEERLRMGAYSRAIDRAGDLDGDGFEDVIVGVAGDVKVRSGDDGSVIFTVPGRPTITRFGSAPGSVRNAGDVNGDGVPDLVVGAPDDNHPNSLYGPRTGGASVFSGIDGARIRLVYGRSPDGHLGTSVSGVGDIDGDGYDEFAVGEPGHDGLLLPLPDAGRVSVYSGANSAVLRFVGGDTAGERLGTAVSGAGDVNGDGVPDVIAGAPFDDYQTRTECGSVAVLSGSDGSLIHRIHGRSAGDRFGSAVSGVGDVNADGFDDFLVGAPDDPAHGSFGSAELYSGFDGSRLRVHSGQAGSAFGGYVAGGEDFDGDGFPDYLVGAHLHDHPQHGQNCGRVRVFSGRSGVLLQELYGQNANTYLGECTTFLDLNRDGYADFGVCAAGLASSVHLYDSRLRDPAGRARFFGHGCPGSNGHLPRAAIDGRPAFGQSFDALVRNAPAMAPAISAIGFVRQHLDLTPFGMPGCVGLVNPIATSFTLADPAGVATFHQSVPNNASLAGLPFHCQWFVFNPGATPLGLSTSNGLLAVVGL